MPTTAAAALSMHAWGGESPTQLGQLLSAASWGGGCEVHEHVLVVLQLKNLACSARKEHARQFSLVYLQGMERAANGQDFWSLQRQEESGMPAIQSSAARPGLVHTQRGCGDHCTVPLTAAHSDGGLVREDGGAVGTLAIGSLGGLGAGALLRGSGRRGRRLAGIIGRLLVQLLRRGKRAIEPAGQEVMKGRPVKPLGFQVRISGGGLGSKRACAHVST